MSRHAYGFSGLPCKCSLDLKELMSLSTSPYVGNAKMCGPLSRNPESTFKRFASNREGKARLDSFNFQTSRQRRRHRHRCCDPRYWNPRSREADSRLNCQTEFLSASLQLLGSTFVIVSLVFATPTALCSVTESSPPPRFSASGVRGVDGLMEAILIKFSPIEIMFSA